MITSLLGLCAVLTLGACDSAKTEGKKAAPGAKAAAPVANAAADPNRGAQAEAPAPEIKLVETDLTAAAGKDMPGFSGTLKMKIPDGATFSAGVGRLKVTKGDFELEIGSGHPVKKRKQLVGDGKLYKDLKYLQDTDSAIVFSAKMFGQLAYFVSVNAPAIGGLICSCGTGMAGAKTEAGALKVLEACQSVKYDS